MEREKDVIKMVINKGSRKYESMLVGEKDGGQSYDEILVLQEHIKSKLKTQYSIISHSYDSPHQTRCR